MLHARAGNEPSVEALKISVVIPTHNRSRLVAGTIASIAAQTSAPLEVIVVDNGSTDDTPKTVRDLIRRVRGLRYIEEPRLGVSVARNRGAAEASGDLVAFLDDDAVASRRWLERLGDALGESTDAAAAAGPIGLRWTRPAPTWVRGLESWYGRFDLGPQRDVIRYPRYPFASNLCFRREAFLAVGGFPVELGPRGAHRVANEEDGLFRRVGERGWPVVYEPGALVYHWVHTERLTRRYLLRRAVTQGRSDVLVDALFASSRSRTERLRRSAEAARETFDAARIAFTRRRSASPMRALAAAGTSLGRAVGEAGFALSIRRRP